MTFDPLANVGDTPTGDLSSLFPGIDKNTATMNVLLKRGASSTPGVGIAGTVIPALGAAAQIANPDEQAPVLQVLSGFYQLDSPNLIGLQQRLYAGGFYSSSFYNKNSPSAITQVHDDDTLSAYTRAVKKAARSGMTVDEAINEGFAGGPGGAGGKGGSGGGGSTRAPLSISLTNPTDLQFVANKAGQALLGRNLNDKELAAFTQSFHGQETTAQKQAYNAATGGTAVAAPNAQTAAEAQIRANAPVEAGAHDVAGTFDAFLSLLGGK